MANININLYDLNNLPNAPLMSLSDDSLYHNIEPLYKNLRNELIKARLTANNYNIVSQGDSSITVVYNPPEINPPEEESLNKFIKLCEIEAEIIARGIYNFIYAARKSLQVKTPHGKDATEINSLLAAHKTTPDLESKYFEIEAGGNSAPKGLDI